MEPEIKQENNFNACCEGCVRWQKFGKNCFYYWENKTHCTMRTSDYTEAMQQQL